MFLEIDEIIGLLIGCGIAVYFFTRDGFTNETIVIVLIFSVIPLVVYFGGKFL